MVVSWACVYVCLSHIFVHVWYWCLCFCGRICLFILPSWFVAISMYRNICPNLSQSEIVYCKWNCLRHIASTCLLLRARMLRVSPLLLVPSSSDRHQLSVILCSSAAASVASSWWVEASDCSLLGVVNRRIASHTTPPSCYQTWGNSRLYFLPLSFSRETLWHGILFCGWGETTPKNLCIFPHKCILWWKAWWLSIFAHLIL